MLDGFPAHAIAIIGLAGRFPGSAGIDEFWRQIKDGVETLELLSDADLKAAGVPEALSSSPSYVAKCSTLQRADYFDAEFFGFSPRDAQILDPQQRIFLECAWEAIENAGYSGHAPELSVGVYAGASMNTYLVSQLLKNPDFVANVGGYQLMLGNDKDFLCTRVSYKLDLQGPSVAVQTACSTSLVAVEIACRALTHGECDLALAGGVSVTFPQRAGYLYEEGMILSPDGHCRPFDAEARGTRGGAGAGIVVLKRLTDAVADRDTIHAVIRGAAINNDGARKAGYTAPSVDGQVEVIATAQAMAGVDPRSISYIEAHGTGTTLGDPIEIAALTRVFRASTTERGFCRIGSVKANIGHLDAAAGVAALIKAVLMLEHRQIPPLVNFREANPLLHIGSSPFLVSTSSSDWNSDSGPRRAGVSSFGIGGTNAHVVLEEAPTAAPNDAVRDHYLLPISAKSAAALERVATRLADHLNACGDLSVNDVAWTLGVGRRAFEHRRAVVVKDRTDAIEQLKLAAASPASAGIHVGSRRPVAFLFTGQGSQRADMGVGLYESEPIYRQALDRCASILEKHLGANICDLTFGSSNDAAINETRLAQPLLFATEYALASLWIHWGAKPAAMLGHSIGEYVAAHLAGVMSLEDALEIVAERGRLMQSLPSGSMAAVSCAPEQLRGLLGDCVEIAALNAPQMCVISGETQSVGVLLRQLAMKNIDARPLRTSHAFHSAMMEPILDAFTQRVARVKLGLPQIPYVSNVTGEWIRPEEATSPAYYARHLRRTVQFASGIRTLAKDSSIYFLELGPGATLTTLTRLILGTEHAQGAVASLPQSGGDSERESMLRAAGRLWVAGIDVNWGNLYGGSLPRRIPLPTYPFERKRYWVDRSETSDSDEVSTSHAPASSVEHWLFAPTWIREASRHQGNPRIDGAWLLMARPGALADAIVQHMQRAGARPIVIEPGNDFRAIDAEHYQIRPGQSQDIASVVHSLGSENVTIRGAVYVMDELARSPAAGLGAYHALVALAEAVSGPPVRIMVATFGAEEVLDEPVHQPAAALTIGPVLTLPIEVPNLEMRSIDFGPLHETGSFAFVAKALVLEAASTDLENVIAWRGGRRWMRRLERISASGAADNGLPLKRGGVYLITGGLGGIGLTIARLFAASTSVRIVLTARTALPPRVEWDGWLAAHSPDDQTATIIRNIRQIEQMGSEVLTIAADVANFEQMERAIESVQTRWGRRVDGVVHAAGVPGAGQLSFLKGPGQVEAVLSPKVTGLGVLVRLLGDVPLDFVALMSSINSILGAPGLCDYASANGYLDAFVGSKECPATWCRVVSIDWGRWREIGMAANLEKADPKITSRFDPRLTISPGDGARAFAMAVNSSHKRVIIAPFDISKHITPLHRDDITRTISAGIAPSKDIEEKEASLDVGGTHAEPTNETERRIAEIWCSVLGVAEVGIDDNFLDLGGHSLLATRVLARIEKSLHVRLTLRDVFDHPTVRMLAVQASGSVSSAERAVESREDRVEIEF
jgi:phthiocerol/phenolphthiocerol synthesis type-I polyketide synthase E